MTLVYTGLKRRLLAVLEVPPEPAAPHGSPGSLAVFRAARGYYKYRIFTWALMQLVLLGALAGGALAVALASRQPDVPELVRRVLWGAGVAPLGVWLLVLPLSWAALRLDYDLRWYMVTDRSLRVREGVFVIREQTLTFVNVQNVSIEQGPIQRLLGIADLRVQTAGGGSHRAQDGGADLHAAVLRGIENAAAVRDLVLERLRRARDAGLGDLDDDAAARAAESSRRNTAARVDPASTPPAEPPTASDPLYDVLAALRAEARALREAAERVGGS